LLKAIINDIFAPGGILKALLCH